MKKYFFTDGRDRYGPFSLTEMKRKNLPGTTRIWYQGLNDWISISEVKELTYRNISKRSKNKNQFYLLLALIVGVVAVTVGSSYFESEENNNLYNSIAGTSFHDTDTDFQIYVDKFYRDAEFYGIYPKKPRETIIKFAELDQLDNTTHIHAISYGFEDDERIEIYINPSTWKKFNKPMRYYLMYHELSHDVLNLDDLEMSPINEGKLMYPSIVTYESLTMDDFIERSHAVFEEVSSTF